jgi:phosphoglycolate phosphatase
MLDQSRELSFNMPRRTIIFDLDGTLVDSLPDLESAVNTVLGEIGQPPLPRAAAAAMVGDGTAKLVERALAASGAGHHSLGPVLERFLALYEAQATVLTRPYPDVPEILAALRAAGHRLAVCTNKPMHATRAVLQGLDLDRCFDMVLGGDSLPVRKPDPTPLLAILERLGGGRQGAAMVGDHRNDVAAAHGAGLPAVFARYGYGEASLGRLAPEATITRFAELPAALDLIWQERPAPSGS